MPVVFILAGKKSEKSQPPVLLNSLFPKAVFKETLSSWAAKLNVSTRVVVGQKHLPKHRSTLIFLLNFLGPLKKDVCRQELPSTCIPLALACNFEAIYMDLITIFGMYTDT